jgi:hypothetical protein
MCVFVCVCVCVCMCMCVSMCVFVDVNVVSMRCGSSLDRVWVWVTGE